MQARAMPIPMASHPAMTRSSSKLGRMHRLLKLVNHRPWPLPSGPWIMKQVWHDLLFAHWPISADIIRPLVPRQLALDIFDDRCWVGVVPFWMSGVRVRGIPALPGLSRFPELNVRTYVSLGSKPGVYFFSLDAANLPAVWAARRFYRLPYFYASMSSVEADGEIHYSSRRKENPAQLRARYEPTSQIRSPAKGSFEYWLTERYCLYTVHNGQVYRGEIHHPPWPLQDATAEFEVNTMAAPAGIELPKMAPVLHFSRRQDVLIWPLRRTRDAETRV
jgi:uncharacterized protein